ncbi:MAG: Maf family protein [Thermoanaerobaculia bacterium]|nr:Maf family protein [Thermoanaerobaculia bacterium]
MGPEDSLLILASGSPRRRELLESIGLEFEIRTSDVPEELGTDESPVEYVERLAREKAFAIASGVPHAWVIAADTVVYLDREVLEKPADRNHAIEMLGRLAGRTHTVYSGVTLMNHRNGHERTESIRTNVTIAPLDRDTIEWYVDTGEPMDKAGAYAIQGLGAMFVETVEGNYTNVVGLPIPTLFRMMSRAGISPIGSGSGRSRG